MIFSESSFWFLAVFFLCLFFLKLAKGIKNKHESKTVRVLMWCLFLLPIWFVGWISLPFSNHALSVSGKIDSALIYGGATADGAPYTDPAQVSSPTLFAFCRFLLTFGDGSIETFKRLIFWGNWLSLLCIAICIVLAFYIHVKRAGFPSELSIVSLLCIIIASIAPIAMIINVGNVGIFASVFVFLYMLCRYASTSKWANLGGGIALGISFMIKPYLLVAIVFIFFSALRKRDFYGVGGVITAGIVGFFCSLMVSGIDLDAYWLFLTKVPEVLTSELVQEHWIDNRSLIIYVPAEFKKIASLCGLLGFCAVAYFASRRPQSDETPWFFITIVPLPLMWGTYILGAPLPAIVFLFFKMTERERLVLCASTVSLAYFSIIYPIPVIVNALLLGLWLWQILPLFLNEEQQKS
jgi:hypothetical protein